VVNCPLSVNPKVPLAEAPLHEMIVQMHMTISLAYQLCSVGLLAQAISWEVQKWNACVCVGPQSACTEFWLCHSDCFPAELYIALLS